MLNVLIDQLCSKLSWHNKLEPKVLSLSLFRFTVRQSLTIHQSKGLSKLPTIKHLMVKCIAEVKSNPTIILTICLSLPIIINVSIPYNVTASNSSKIAAVTPG